MCFFSLLGSGLGTMALSTAIMSDIAATAAAGALAGGVFSTVSSVQNTRQQAAMADFQAEQENRNAYLARREAEAIELQGNQERLQLRLESQQKEGAANAAYAANGVVLGAGTPADYAADIADAYDLDSRNLNYDIASRRWKTQVAGINAADQARAYRAAAGGYRANVAPTLLGGAFSTVGSTLGAAAAGMDIGSRIGKLF